MITKNKLIKIIDLAKKCNECALHHFKEFDNNLNLVSSDSAPDYRSTDTSNMSYKYDKEAVYSNDLAFYKDVNE